MAGGEVDILIGVGYLAARDTLGNTGTGTQTEHEIPWDTLGQSGTGGAWELINRSQTKYQDGNRQTNK